VGEPGGVQRQQDGLGQDQRVWPEGVASFQ
jgi:hypothetical protein